MPITKVLISLRQCAGWSASLLFANPEDRFSRIEAHISDADKKKLFSALSLFLIKRNVTNTLKNHLTEMVLFSIHNISVCKKQRK